MDNTERFYAEIEGDEDANKVREYFRTQGIEFVEYVDDYKFVGDWHVFKCYMTMEQLLAANRNTDALFYQ